MLAKLIKICQQEKISFSLEYDCGYREFYQDNQWQAKWDSPGFTITVNGYGFTDSFGDEKKYRDLDHAIEAGLQLATIAVNRLKED